MGQRARCKRSRHRSTGTRPSPMVAPSVLGNSAAVLECQHPVLPGSDILFYRCRRCADLLVDIANRRKIVAAHAEQSIDRVAGAYVQASRLKAPAHVQACLRARFGRTALPSTEHVHRLPALHWASDAISWRRAGPGPHRGLRTLPGIFWPGRTIVPGCWRRCPGRARRLKTPATSLARVTRSPARPARLGAGGVPCLPQTLSRAPRWRVSAARHEQWIGTPSRTSRQGRRCARRDALRGRGASPGAIACKALRSPRCLRPRP